MFKNLETQPDIAERKMYSLGSVRNMACRDGFPKPEKSIGSVKFYNKTAIDRYFKAKVDRRFKRKEIES